MTKALCNKTWEQIGEEIEKKTVDTCQAFLDLYCIKSTRTSSTVEIPTFELIYRTLGFDLKSEFTVAALTEMVNEEGKCHGNPRFGTVDELISYLAYVDGWNDQQKIADNISALIDLVRKADYRTEIGEDYRDSFIKYLEDQRKIWDRKTSDPLPQHVMGEREEYNWALHNLLEEIQGECFKTAIRLYGEHGEMIAKPENIAGHPIERPKPEPDWRSVENISAYLKHLEKDKKG